jgi:hypothetical protein
VAAIKQLLFLFLLTEQKTAVNIVFYFEVGEKIELNWSYATVFISYATVFIRHIKARCGLIRPW